MIGSAKQQTRQAASTVGARAFAGIVAVEGLRLSAVSQARLSALTASGLSPDEQRAEVVRAYAVAKTRP